MTQDDAPPAGHKASGQYDWIGSGYPPPPDEISLVDLWLVFARRWKVLAAVCLVGIGAAVAYALLKPPAYRYYSTVQVGQVLERTSGGGERDVPIDSPKSVMALLNDSFIPAAIAQYAGSGGRGSDPTDYRLTAKVSPDSDVVTVSGKGPLARQAAYRQLIDAATGALLTHENVMVSSVRSGLTAKLEQAKIKLANLKNASVFQATLANQKQKIAAANNKLSSLQEAAKVLQQRIGRLKQKRKLLAQQIKATRQTINAANGYQLKAASGIGSPTTAMTQLLLGNTLQQSRNQLTRLQEALYVNLPNQRAALAQKLHDNGDAQDNERSRLAFLQSQLAKIKIEHRNRIANQQQTVNALKARIGRLRPTQVLLEPTRSQNPVSSRRLIVALGAVGSAMLAMLLVFVLELRDAARTRKDQEAANTQGSYALAPSIVAEAREDEVPRPVRGGAR